MEIYRRNSKQVIEKGAAHIIKTIMNNEASYDRIFQQGLLSAFGKQQPKPILVIASFFKSFFSIWDVFVASCFFRFECSSVQTINDNYSSPTQIKVGSTMNRRDAIRETSTEKGCVEHEPKPLSASACLSAKFCQRLPTSASLCLPLQVSASL